VDGRNYQLLDFAEAKILVVVFTCNHCPTAQAYEDRIIKMTSDYKNKGVAVVAIMPNDPLAVRLDELGYSDMSDTFEEMKIRVKDKGYNFPYLYDGKNQKVAFVYGPVATPHLFIFDNQRKLRYTGRFDDSEKKPNQVNSKDAINAIEAILAGKKVPVEKTMAFGCSIKWADKRDSVKAAFASWAREKVSLEKINAKEVSELVKNNTAKIRLINIWEPAECRAVRAVRYYEPDVSPEGFRADCHQRRFTCKGAAGPFRFGKTAGILQELFICRGRYLPAYGSY
jgi:thiol-disulfide isomerase/thioredoxin